MNSVKEITLTKENFGNSIANMINILSEFKSTAKEINRANLFVEEIFFCWNERAKNTESSVKMNIYRRLGETKITLRLKGDSYNPMTMTFEEDENEIRIARMAILRSSKDRVFYSYSNGENVITIVVHRISSKKKKLIYTVTAMILGISTGFLMQAFLPYETILSIDLIADMIRKIFLQMLNMLVAPVTFFSIASGLSQMSDAGDAGRIGIRLAVVTVVMMLTMSLLSMTSGLFFFSEDLSFMRDSIAVTEVVADKGYFSVMVMLAEMFPKNLIDPIQSGNIMQVMFLAIFFGILIGRIEPRLTWINDGINSLRRVFISALEIVVITIPLVVFLSMMSLADLSRPESLLQLVKLIIGQGFGVILALVVASFMIIILTKTSPVNFIKKIIAFSPVPFAAASSNGAMPDTMKFATENLGISSKLTSFVVPVGLQFNKQGNCFFFAMSTAMMLKVYGIEVTTDSLITFFITLFFMSITKPSIPCAGIICLTYLFSAMKIPAESVMTVLGIEPIMALFIAVCNVLSNSAVSFIVARKENMVDLNIYEKPMH